jgi:hypothetical protein
VFDLHEAVDTLQADAEASGLVEQIGQDAVQTIMAKAFAAVRENIDVVHAHIFREDIEDEQTNHGVARSVIDAVEYLIRENSPEWLRAFLAKHSAGERAAIEKYFQRKGSGQ